MPRSLDKQAVRAWLSGQRAAGDRMQEERAKFLISLTPERSLEIYLGIWGLETEKRRDTPSPLLLAVRQALLRLKERAEER